MKYYQIAIDRYSDYAVVLNNIGVIYTETNEYDKALQCFLKAIVIRPSEYLYHYNVAYLYYKLSDYDIAIRYFEATITIQPDFYLAYYNKGNLHSEKGEYDKAIACYQKAVEIQPDYHNAYNSWGFLLIQSGAIKDAEPILQKAVEYGNLDYGNMNLGHIYLCQGDKDKALSYYRISLSNCKNKEEFWDIMHDDLQYLAQYGITEAYYHAVLAEIEEGKS